MAPRGAKIDSFIYLFFLIDVSLNKVICVSRHDEKSSILFSICQRRVKFAHHRKPILFKSMNWNKVWQIKNVWIAVCLIDVIKWKTVAKKWLTNSKKTIGKWKPEKSFKKAAIAATDRRFKSTKLKNSAELKISIGGEALTLDTQQISRLALNRQILHP